VFGNSNFVRNPNAQTTNCTTTGTVTCQNVTVSNAEITRSTTTPLVAKSEFLMITTTLTGYADWALRTFDAGMKGQNCEARFSYRGFSVGSTTAQILQGANVVAQLALTPSTDPRIASINFPCGDLSAVTKFRLQQASALLTGTNEIGGVYVGLATNMANVAQAEEYGGIEYYSGGISNNWAISQTTYAADFAASGSNGTAFGKCSAPATALPQLICNNVPAGNYQIVWPMFIELQTANTVGYCRVIEENSGNVIQEISTGSFNTGTGGYTGRSATLVGQTSFSSAGTRKFKLQCKTDNGSQLNVVRFSAQNNTKVIAYRFPSSSELVVKPETQNVWGGVVYTNTMNHLLRLNDAASSTFYEFNNAGWNQPTMLKGKAAVTTTGSGNDLGFSISNLPVGNYNVKISGVISSEIGSTTAANIVECNFRIRETITGTTIASIIHKDTYSNGQTRDYPNSLFGIYTNTSLGTRNFRLEASKTFDNALGNASRCQAYAANTSFIAFTLEPLDQPSNSALYVEGPVKAAATGAAIPAGYLGNQISDVYSFTIGYASNQTVLTKTYPAGNYLLIWESNATWPAAITIANFFVHSCYIDGVRVLGDTVIPQKPGLTNAAVNYTYVGSMISNGSTPKTFVCDNFGGVQTATSSGKITAILLN